jgi:hypothetical protein
MAIDALNRKNLVEDTSVKITQLRMEKQKEMTLTTNMLLLGNIKDEHQCRSMHKEDVREYRS